MSFPPPIGGDARPFPADFSRSGPEAHEDLTLAEHLETMRICDDERPGGECFLDSNGVKQWVAEAALRDFITQHGAEHPSGYLAAHGEDWQQSLFTRS